MASPINKHFHTYENVGYDDQSSSKNDASNGNSNNHYVPQQANIPSTGSSNTAASISIHSHSGGGIAIKTAIDSPFPDPILDAPCSIPSTTEATVISATDSNGNTRMLTSKALPGQNLVTKLITFPSQSPMDSIKEWSVSTFKCAKQLINEKRGICSVTSDAQLQAEIELLRENRSKFTQMLRNGQQMTNHYAQLVRSQKQLHSLMNEMSMKCLTTKHNQTPHSKRPPSKSKQIVANFSSLGNNLSSTTTNQLTNSENFDDFLPILSHMKNSSVNLTEEFKRNALTLNATIKNGEKLVSALNHYCSNLSTLINKTIEDTLLTVKQYELARLEYDAERNSLNFMSPNAQTSMTYSSDKLEMARMRYEQMKEEVQIKLRLLEENMVKVVHKQLLLFNGAFASYSNGNTAALDATLKQFCVR